MHGSTITFEEFGAFFRKQNPRRSPCVATYRPVGSHSGLLNTSHLVAPPFLNTSHSCLLHTAHLVAPPADNSRHISPSGVPLHIRHHEVLRVVHHLGRGIEKRYRKNINKKTNTFFSFKKNNRKNIYFQYLAQI